MIPGVLAHQIEQGLEFDHIIIAGADAESIPLKSLISSAETPIEKEETDKQERSLGAILRLAAYDQWTSELSPVGISEAPDRGSLHLTQISIL